MDDYIKTRHSVYMLTYHVIFVTKYRKPVITDEIGDFMVEYAKRLCLGYGGELVSGETNRDHIHLLISLPAPADSVTGAPESENTAVQGDQSCSGIQ